MDPGAVLGLLSGIVLMTWAIGADGGLRAFWDLPAIMITFGGTLAATMLNYRLGQVLGGFKVLRNAFGNRRAQPEVIFQSMTDYATRARREGLLALDREIGEVKDPFLAKGLQLVVDGTDSEMTRAILETDLAALEQRHQAGQAVFETMGNFAPSFGLVGTLIGLIKMLRVMDDPSAIGPGMSVALLTTFYGALFAFLICLPLAGKLKVCHEEEWQAKQIMIEGLLAIQAGHNPRMIEEKLRAHLSPAAKRALERRESAAAAAGAGESLQQEVDVG
ncbi:MAG TPA: motility protein A [Clostridiales bacterium]|nr:motility protein A [Clostridiales bacterium]